MRFALDFCSSSATIGFGTFFSKTSAEIHDNVYVGPRCCLGLVTLERDVLLGPAVQIPSGPKTHGIDRLDLPIREQPGQHQRVTVGEDSWIGGGALVLADVARQNIIGAGSVLTKSTEPREIWVGSPARRLAIREELNSCNAE